MHQIVDSISNANVDDKESIKDVMDTLKDTAGISLTEENIESIINEIPKIDIEVNKEEE